jgi:hypothetical protein
MWSVWDARSVSHIALQSDRATQAYRYGSGMGARGVPLPWPSAARAHTHAHTHKTHGVPPPWGSAGKRVRSAAQMRVAYRCAPCCLLHLREFVRKVVLEDSLISTRGNKGEFAPCAVGRPTASFPMLKIGTRLTVGAPREEGAMWTQIS